MALGLDSAMSLSTDGRQHSVSIGPGVWFLNGLVLTTLLNLIFGSNQSGILALNSCPLAPINCSLPKSSSLPGASPRTYTNGFLLPVGSMWGFLLVAILFSGQTRHSSLCKSSSVGPLACLLFLVGKKPIYLSLYDFYSVLWSFLVTSLPSILPT